MTEALYGDGGFYRASGAPGRNFRTAAHTSSLWATAILGLADRVFEALGSPASFTLVDVGAGGGELLSALASIAPADWTLRGVDLAPRPDSLSARVSWSSALPDRFDGLLIANELLDVVPVDVAELAAGWPRQIEVTPGGEEELGDLVTGRDAEWLSTWWPLAEDGDRAEIGWPRDELWHSLTERLGRGAAVAIDYAALPHRDVAGTLTGYRDGRQVAAVPDGSCDLTAHVLFESLAAPGDVMLTQREALQSLGISGHRPAYDGDPSSYLAALSSTGDAAELLDPAGLGAFTWLVHVQGCSLALTRSLLPQRPG
jgi:SAM-dependent MidA family methyltransferase